MAKRLTVAAEVSDATRALLERHANSDPLEAAGEIALGIFNEALTHGLPWKHVLGMIYLNALQAAEAAQGERVGGRKRRNRRDGSDQPPAGDEAA